MNRNLIRKLDRIMNDSDRMELAKAIGLKTLACLFDGLDPQQEHAMSRAPTEAEAKAGMNPGNEAGKYTRENFYAHLLLR